MTDELALLSNFDKAKSLIQSADLAAAMEWMSQADALRIYATKAKKRGWKFRTSAPR